jgi:hypothetical protein
MSAEENPPNEMNLTPGNKLTENEVPQDENPPSSSMDASESDEEIVLAELADVSSNENEVVVAELDRPTSDNFIPAPAPTGFKTEDMTARGAAIASVVLGILSIAGAFFSPYSAINGSLGIFMWFVGFSKTRSKNHSYLGLGLCLSGLLLSISTGLGLIATIIICLLMVARTISTRRQRRASD